MVCITFALLVIKGNASYGISYSSFISAFIYHVYMILFLSLPRGSKSLSLSFVCLVNGLINATSPFSFDENSPDNSGSSDGSENIERDEYDYIKRNLQKLIHSKLVDSSKIIIENTSLSSSQQSISTNPTIISKNEKIISSNQLQLSVFPSNDEFKKWHITIIQKLETHFPIAYR